MTDTQEIQRILMTRGADAVTTRVVWTKAYQPFLMGGDVHAPIKTTVPVLGPFDAGKGFTVYLALSPKENIHVVESETGAFIGSSLAQVRADIAQCDDIEFMKQQVRDAGKLFERAMEKTPDEFWSMFRSER